MTRRSTLFYGWIVVAVAALVALLTAGVRSAPGAFIPSMTEEPAAAFVAAGWIAIIAGFAPVAIRRPRPPQPVPVRVEAAA